MRTTQRARRAGLAAAAAIVIGGSGVAIGAAATESSASGTTVTATPGPVVPGRYAGPDSYAGVVRQVLPSVVLIRTADGLGSGVVLDRSGNIVTNAHVAGNATKFQVQVSGDTAPRTARLVGTYPPDDLAVIRADDPSGLEPARFGDSDQVQAGDVVLAMGNPLGLSGSVTQGIISATDRAVTEPATPGLAGQGRTAAALPGAIQTSAPINPGNSGGALVSASGQVIGIPTLAAVSPQGGAQAQGIGFAIPSNTVKKTIADLLKHPGVHQGTDSGYIGIYMGPLTPGFKNQTGYSGEGGIGIGQVFSGSPADQAGLAPGDVILQADGKPMNDVKALHDYIASKKPGDTIHLEVWSQGAKKLVTIKVEEKPAGGVPVQGQQQDPQDQQQQDPNQQQQP